MYIKLQPRQYTERPEISQKCYIPTVQLSSNTEPNYLSSNIEAPPPYPPTTLFYVDHIHTHTYTHHLTRTRRNVGKKEGNQRRLYTVQSKKCVWKKTRIQPSSARKVTKAKSCKEATRSRKRKSSCTILLQFNRPSFDPELTTFTWWCPRIPRSVTIFSSVAQALDCLFSFFFFPFFMVAFLRF